MTTEFEASFRIPAARFRVRVMHHRRSLLKNEGAGNAGRWPHPQALWAEKENAHKSVQLSRNIRHSLRNGFTAYSALSLGYRAF